MNTANYTNSDVDKLVAANNDLGFRLLSQLVGQEVGKNVFLSSFSVAVALAMTYNGAEGKTKQAMAKVLGLTGLGLQEINDANATFMSMQDGLDPKVQLAIANSIWARDGIELAPGGAVLWSWESGPYGDQMEGVCATHLIPSRER